MTARDGVGVLAAMEDGASAIEAYGGGLMPQADDLRDARKIVAELIEAATDVDENDHGFVRLHEALRQIHLPITRDAAAKPMTEGEQLAAQDRAIARVAGEMAAAKPEGGGESIARKFDREVLEPMRKQDKAATRPPSSTAPEALDVVALATLEKAQWGYLHRRCSVCGGFDAKGNGETDYRHTNDCPLAAALAHIRKRLTTPAQPAVQGGGSREVVFLVEAKFPDGSTRWLTAKGLHKYRAPEFDHWTTDANSARRFLRRGYAEKVVQEQYLADEHHAFVTEHMWIGGPAEDVDPPGNPANSHPQPAVQPASAEAVDVGPEWTPVVKLPVVVHVREQRPGEQHISTREGITPVKPDDLIIRGVEGEEYPIGRDLFNRTYRAAGNAPAVQGEREAVMRSALEKVIAAVGEYLPPDGIDADELISRVIEATDNAEIVRAMK